ncbi:MAG: hypothetical protein PHV39_07195, partial [Methanomicrobium sp.]|nr:hypothetical protein [Methanomicrobium sp.]
MPELPAYTINQSISNITTASVIDKNNLTDDEKKLSTALLLESKYSQNITAQELAGTESGLITKNEISSNKQIYAYVYLLPGYSTHIIDSVADVTDRDETNNIAVAWIDSQNLKVITAIDGVKTVREVVAPVTGIGSVTTEGDIVHKTANVRSAYGYSGSGVKIGIISDGVNNIADSQASGDLPDDVHVLSDIIGGDEGTAMLEIVHDM